MTEAAKSFMFDETALRSEIVESKVALEHKESSLSNMDCAVLSFR